MIRRMVLFTMLTVTSCLAVMVSADEVAIASNGVEMRLADTELSDGFEHRVEYDEGKILYLQKAPVIKGSEVTSVRFENLRSVQTDIGLTFTDKAARRLQQATSSNIGKRMAVMLDGKVIFAPTIHSGISDQAKITGEFSRAELLRIFETLVLSAQQGVDKRR